MARSRYSPPDLPEQEQDYEGSPPDHGRRGLGIPRPPGGFWGALISLFVAWGVLYGLYTWFVKRIVVGGDQVLVLLKKNGSKSLPGDQIVIPKPPDAAKDKAAYEAWEKEYGDCNGIQEQVYKAGTYFVSPIDYERFVVPLVKLSTNEAGLVIRKFGDRLPPGQVLADPNKAQRGPLPGVLSAGGSYEDYSNPYAYEVKRIKQTAVDPGHQGVITIMAGKATANPNQYLVAADEQGIQPKPEPEGYRFINPFEKRITPISVQSQRFEMVGTEAISFPSSDSFPIKMEGFVEWEVDRDRLPEIYVKYGEGGDLIELLQERVILPYARAYCRLLGSQHLARDFIAGDTKLKFQEEFQEKLKEECIRQGIRIQQALVRDIIPPDEIKVPINEREIARQQVFSLNQQMTVAKSQAELGRQTELGTQNQKIGEAKKQVVTIVKRAEQERDVALTLAKQKLEVARFELEAAKKDGEAIIRKARAEAAVLLADKLAEAEPLRQQVAAFGDGEAYAQYFFYQKVAPSIKTILTNTEGPFSDIFRQFATPPAATRPAAASSPNKPNEKLTEVQP